MWQIEGVFIATQLNWTQLNSTDPVEQRTAKSVAFLFMTSLPTNWVNCCSCCRVEFSQVQLSYVAINTPLDSGGNYSATSNNTKLVHWPLMGGLLHLVQRGGAWAGYGPAQSPHRCTKCNSPPINGQCTITVLLYDGLLLCGFNVAIKGLSPASKAEDLRDGDVKLFVCLFVCLSPTRAAGAPTVHSATGPRGPRLSQMFPRP